MLRNSCEGFKVFLPDSSCTTNRFKSGIDLRFIHRMLPKPKTNATYFTRYWSTMNSENKP